MNWFDILVAIIILYSFFKGYSSGFIKQLASLAGIIACILLSGKVSSVILPHLQKLGNIPDKLLEPAAFIAAFIIIAAAFLLLGHMLQSILETIKLGFINKIAGAGLGLIKWMIVLSMILNLLVKIDEHHVILPADISARSLTYKYIQPIAPSITPYLKFNFTKETA